MSLAGMICAVVFPRILIILFHFSGKLVRIKRGGHIRWLTFTGLILASVIFITIAVSTFYTGFNFKEEAVSIKIKDLNKDLEGLKIVQISDLHLSAFYHHTDFLIKVVDMINGYHPDIIINTGDFITFGWREYGRNDTILAKAKSRYGNFAIMGNHDAGTYNPDFTEADIENNTLIMNNLIRSSGYKVLNDEFTKIKIGNSQLAFIGVTTRGRHPDIIHGDLQKAIAGLDSADLRVLLTHDPNHWEEAVKGKTSIELTFSGHTHGMQMGIMTKKYKWSPAKYFYPHWNGLYSEGEQIQYVNRGLGLLAITFRIWMPPEITIITLENE
jgi:predicted MPP superfamily phosphohydrolase